MQVSSASSAQAQELAKQLRERMFSRADQDGSGGLNLNEFSAIRPGKSGMQAASSAGGTAGTEGAAKIFAKLDSDGDGSVTETELEAGRPGKAGGAFSAGSMSTLLSGQEASGTQGADGLFSSLDTDGDGSLTAAEFQAGRPEGGPRGAGGPPPGRGGGGTGDGSATSLLSSSTDDTSAADALAALMKRALENYLQSGAAQSSAGVSSSSGTGSFASLLASA